MSKKLTPIFNKVTEVDLIYRNKQRPSERPRIINSKSAHDLFLESWNKDKIELQEQFKVMLLDRNNSCLGISHVSTGGVSACVVDPKIIFATALKAGASAIILAHNHPSGNLKPSNADRDITGRLCFAGGVLEIPVLDHIIITNEGYLSFADDGLLPEAKGKVSTWEQLLSPLSPS